MANSKLTLYDKGRTINTGSFAGFLDVDRIRRNPIYKCSISGGRNSLRSVVGIYNPDSPFTISVGSEYVDSFQLPSDIQDKMNQAVGGFAANVAGKSQFIFKSLAMTEQRWNGSTSPEFSIRLDIPIVRKEDAPWTIIKYVLQAVCGTQTDYQSGQVQRAESAWQIFAPNGYSIQYAQSATGSDTPRGTYTIALGEGRTCWFRMHKALITNIDCQIGGKKYYDGNPTSVTVNVSFKYWRQPLYEDIVSWFPLANNLASWVQF